MIRPLKESDILPLTAIYNYYVRTSTATFETIELTEEQMRLRLLTSSKRYPCIVAELNQKVVGYCAAHPWRPRFDNVAEVTMYIAPNECSKGLGAEMLTEIISLCKQKKGLNGLIACINADNNHSRALVEHFGFILAGHYCRVANKFGQWLDDVDYMLRF